MIVHGLAMENITSYEKSTMTFEKPVNVIVGHNGDGKTTILDAITHGLLGYSARSEKGGGKQDLMVRSGAKQGTITMAISTDGSEPLTLTRTVKSGGGELAIEGQAGNKTVLQENVLDYLGMTAPVLSAALSTNAFVHDMKPSEQKSMLFALLDLYFDRANITDQVMQEAVDDNTLVEQADAMERLLKAAPDNLFTGEASTFEKLHKHFYDLRRVTNRTIKELGEDKPVSPVPSLPDKADVVDQLEELREEKAELQKQQVQSVSDERQRSRLQEQIETLTLRLEDAGDPEEAATEAEDVQARLHTLSSQSDGKRMLASGYIETADKLESAGKSCGYDETGSLIECSLTKPKREKLVSELRARAKAVNEEADKIDVEVQPLGEKYRELKDLCGKPSKVGIQFQIDTAQAELDKLPASSVDAGKISADVEALNERTHNGEELLAQINREEGAAAEREKVQQKRAELSQTAEVLDALVEVLSPKGLPGKILSETIQPIEERANERLQRLTAGRFSLRLVMDPDFAIIVDHDGVSSPLKLLSSSEQQRVGIILQDAIVHLSGLRFLIIDNADVLDPDNRMLLMEFLLDVAEDYEQVIVLSTIGPDGVNPPEPPIEELGLYLLEDGQLREVA